MKKSRKSSYTCPLCNSEVPSRRRGNKKRELVVIPGEVICDICGKPLKSPHGVIVHKARRHGYKSKRLKESTVISSQEILNPSEVAADLLSLVVDRINRDSNLNNQIVSLNNQISELKGSLKKEREEKERILRNHNRIVQQIRYKIERSKR